MTPDEIQVVDWIGPDTDHEVSIGGFGGWFNENNTWSDYLEVCPEERQPYVEALRKEIVSNGKWISGMHHQYEEDGTPLFSDGTIASFSLRAWGDFMAAVSFSVDGKPRSYMDWYHIYTDIPEGAHR